MIPLHCSGRSAIRINWHARLNSWQRLWQARSAQRTTHVAIAPEVDRYTRFESFSCESHEIARMRSALYGRERERAFGWSATRQSAGGTTCCKLKCKKDAVQRNPPHPNSMEKTNNQNEKCRKIYLFFSDSHAQQTLHRRAHRVFPAAGALETVSRCARSVMKMAQQLTNRAVLVFAPSAYICTTESQTTRANNHSGSSNNRTMAFYWS